MLRVGRLSNLSTRLNSQEVRDLQARTYIQASFWIAAAITGVIAVLYARLINGAFNHYLLIFQSYPYAMTAATPLLFVASAAVVVKLAPEAKGSGIPQVLTVIKDSKDGRDVSNSPLVSLRTAFFKILSSLIGLLAGASIGREGPTVQIASSVFGWIGKKMRRSFSQVDPQSYFIAGGAAGIAAAFNTPLAGITFALEEIADGIFSQFKRPVMFSIVIAGITAQALVGNYLYFGHPTILPITLKVIPESLALGMAGGLTGGFFARLLVQKDFKFTFKYWWLKALTAGGICSLVALASHGDSTGSGYEIVRHFMDGEPHSLSLLFGVEKFISTVFSYLSGMAGGIFSPCLSIGAGLGYAFGIFMNVVNLKTCALIGMVAFFSGVVQAPLTAVVIVTEMTDEHSLIIPFMISALVAQLVGRVLMPTPLYHFLAFGAHFKRPLK